RPMPPVAAAVPPPATAVPPPVATAPPVEAQPVMPAGPGRRGDVFDPSQNPNAPGAPRPLGSFASTVPSGAPAPRPAGGPLDLSAPAGPPGEPTHPAASAAQSQCHRRRVGDAPALRDPARRVRPRLRLRAAQGLRPCRLRFS